MIRANNNLSSVLSRASEEIIHRFNHSLKDLTRQQRSPRMFGSSMLNHGIEHMATTQNTSCAAVKVDLRGKIRYDDSQVSTRLHLDIINDDFVQDCAASLLKDNATDIMTLMKIVASAEKMTVEELENNEKQAKLSAKNSNPGDVEEGTSTGEEAMYDPLVRIFSYIADFKHANKTNEPPRRVFHKTVDMLKADGPHMFGIPRVSPDLTITPLNFDISSSNVWWVRDAFGEVKPSRKQSPKLSPSGTIPAIVAQSANYTRLFMSGRPFMLFCVGILIFGTEFCVGIFDRGGIVFSSIHDMFKDPDVFVRVVHSITHILPIQDMGQDPTVEYLSDAQTKELTGVKNIDYPSAIISGAGDNSRRWCTIGAPMWTSLSLLGRGTAVWRVKEYFFASGTSEKLNSQPVLDPNMMILKTSWRSSARSAESDIYRMISQPIAGLARFECGGDVQIFYQGESHAITVRYLRRKGLLGDISSEVNEPTPVLHRLVLSTVGRPLWEYRSDTELLEGLYDALSAHKRLFEAGILHRDISAGNVLLCESESAPVRGFITDLDLARITPPNPVSGAEMSVKTDYTRRGATMTGTAQFMAYEILDNPGTYHEPKHDIESFIWVFHYCVMRRIWYHVSNSNDVKIKEQKKAFSFWYQMCFGQKERRKIILARTSFGPFYQLIRDEQCDKIIKNFMSDTILRLFNAFNTLILKRHGGEDLTYDIVLDLFKQAIPQVDKP